MNNSDKDKVILGIDPGTNIMGYGLISVKKTTPILITLGVIHLKKYEEHSQKLLQIFHKTLSVINQYNPDEMAIEAPFYGKNIQSMLKLGRAQGVCLAAALSKNIPVYEYAPKKIKQSVTGKGTSSKEQVAEMLQRILKHEMNEKFFDATDALAAAVCHLFQNSGAGNIGIGKKKDSWDAFIKSNPGRVK